MKKISLFALVLTSTLILSGCSSKPTTTSIEEEPVAVTTPTATPEAMMEAPIATPVADVTPVDVSADAALKSTKPLSVSTEKTDITTDLKNTTIPTESFN